MSEVEREERPALEVLACAVDDWMEGRDGRPLRRWLLREFDREGAPVRLTVPELHAGLAVLATVGHQGKGWPESCKDRIQGLLRTALRFARSDFRPALDGEESGRTTRSRLGPGDWAVWFRSGDLPRGLLGTPPVKVKKTALGVGVPSTWAASKRVLAVSRSEWLVPASDNFLVAVDHREGPCRFELGSGETVWLGPEWNVPLDEAPAAPPRPKTIVLGPAADLFEWSYRAGTTRATHSALVLREQKLAVLSVLLEGPPRAPKPGWSTRWSLRSNVKAAPLKDCRALGLSVRKQRGGAQALPIGLPCLPYPTDRGSFQVEGQELVLNQASAGRRCWLPLLVSWDGARQRHGPPNWRVLTVSEQGKIVPADRAFAARWRWKRDEAYVVYRSLGPPAPRAFLGHQTRARFLVGRFTTDGDVEPIFQMD